MFRRYPLAPYLFLLPYIVLLLAFGILPLVFALGFSISDVINGGFAGFSNYVAAVTDYRFLSATGHVLTYAAIWIPALVVMTIGLAVALQAVPSSMATLLRGLYFLPGSITAGSLVLLWLFMLDPQAGPFAVLWDALGLHDRFAVMSAISLTGVFALMALYSGAGGWIVVIHGALTSVSQDVVEAATIDGCRPWQLAWRIKLPLISRTIILMVVLSIVNGLQLFVEPELLRLAGQELSRPDWSLNQLAFQYAFGQGDFGVAAALSVLLLTVTLSLTLWIVLRSALFRIP